MAVRRKYIRTLAEKILREHGATSAPVPIDKIVRSLSIDIRRVPADDELSGFLYRESADNTVVIGVNRDQARTRQCFTVAHEFGHYLLHDDDVHVDRKFQVKLRSSVSSEGSDTEEKEANLFAAEILMPASFISDDLAGVHIIDIDDEGFIRSLSRKYKVSPQAMMFRLHYLGYVALT